MSAIRCCLMLLRLSMLVVWLNVVWKIKHSGMTTKPMSQKQKILGALKLGPVCGTTMLDWHIPRYAARIHELRAEGYEITTRPCQLHYHHNSPQIVYELAVTDQLGLAL